MGQHQAAAEAARRKVNRAAGLLRQAGRDLAALADGQTALGVLHVHDTESAEAARDLIALGVGRHGAVDVVVIARPTGRAQHPHHGPRQGAKESTDGTQRHHEEGPGAERRGTPRRGGASHRRG